MIFFFFQAEDGIRDRNVTGVQTCALPICDSSAKRAISVYRLRRVLEVGERTTRQNVQAKCEVLLRGAIVERQPTGSTDDVDAEPRQHHLVPVDPLMGVLTDEHVIAARSGNGS